MELFVGRAFNQRIFRLWPSIQPWMRKPNDLGFSYTFTCHMRFGPCDVYISHFNLCDFLSSIPSGSYVFMIERTVSRLVTALFNLNFWCIVRYPKLSSDFKIPTFGIASIIFKFVKLYLLNIFFRNIRCNIRCKYISWKVARNNFSEYEKPFDRSLLHVLPWGNQSNIEYQCRLKTDWNWGAKTEGIQFSSELQSKVQSFSKVNIN